MTDFARHEEATRVRVEENRRRRMITQEEILEDEMIGAAQLLMREHDRPLSELVELLTEALKDEETNA